MKLKQLTFDSSEIAVECVASVLLELVGAASIWSEPTEVPELCLLISSPKSNGICSFACFSHSNSSRG